MTTTGKNRIMIFGPKTDGTYVVEFRTAEGESLAISIPRTETAVSNPKRASVSLCETRKASAPMTRGRPGVSASLTKTSLRSRSVLARKT
jgi:hypothetical protein